MRGFTNKKTPTTWLFLFLFWLLSAPGCNRTKNSTPTGDTDPTSATQITTPTEGTDTTSATQVTSPTGDTDPTSATQVTSPTGEIDPIPSTQATSPTENTGSGCESLTESEQNKLNKELHSAVSGVGACCTEEKIRELLAKCADPNAQDSNGWAVLHLLASNDQSAFMVKILVDHGANPDKPDKEGHVPLHIAILRGSDKMVFALLKMGANPNLPTPEGHSPLKLVEMEGHPGLMIFYLKKAGAK